MTRARPVALVAALAAAVASLPGSVSGAAKRTRPASAPALPTLSLKVNGRTLRNDLRVLDPSEFEVLSRRSASTVVLGYPRSQPARGKQRRVRPCARITVRLRSVAGTDPEATVATRVTDPTTQGQASIKDGEAFRVFSAWRQRAITENRPTGSSSFELVTSGVAAERRGSRLVLLSVAARTDTRRHLNEACGGTNFYTVGPGVLSLVQAQVVETR